MGLTYLSPLFGGILIGIAVTVMLLFNGRVTGISGIISGIFTTQKKDLLWRWAFLFGLLAGGFVLRLYSPESLENTSGRTIGSVIMAGLLVGYGTVMGGGCTSGHGVCGVSRLSVRSILATVTFILFGVLSVTVIKYFFGGVL